MWVSLSALLCIFQSGLLGILCSYYDFLKGSGFCMIPHSQSQDSLEKWLSLGVGQVKNELFCQKANQ